MPNVNYEIGYSEQDVNQMTEVPRLADGWYKFVARYPSASVNENSGNFFVKFTAVPLEDPNDNDSERGPTISQMLTLPIANKQWAEKEGKEHNAPNTGGICHAAICALYPDHPRMPKKDEDKQWYTSSGELLEDFDAVEVEKARVSRETLDKLVKLWKSDGDDLDGRTFYGLVAASPDGQFSQIKKMSVELPEGEKVNPPEAFKAKKAPKSTSKTEEPKAEEAPKPKKSRR